MKQREKHEWKYLREEVIPISRRWFALCDIYVRGIITTGEAVHMAHPRVLILNNQSRYMPHQGKREKARGISRRHRINDLPKG